MKFNKFILAIIIGVLFAFLIAVLPLWFEFQSKSYQDSTVLTSAISRVIKPTVTPIIESQLTVDKILRWSRELSEVNLDKVPQNEVTQIILVGDVMLGRAVNYNMVRKNDSAYPMLKVADKLKMADLTIGNLENTVRFDCVLTAEGMQLCSNPETLYALLFAGFDAMQIANNHIFDYGDQGLEETLEWLEGAEIEPIGLEQPFIKDVRGVKFGFLSYNHITPVKDPIRSANQLVLQSDIKELKNSADVVIVGFHWGEEYKLYPNPKQRRLAKQAIDAGADVVWGQHPHWVQGIEVYNNKPIFYSLGNFVFDQMFSKPTREGIAVELMYWKDDLQQIKLMPVFMRDFAQPDWEAVGIGSATLGKIERASKFAD